FVLLPEAGPRGITRNRLRLRIKSEAQRISGRDGEPPWRRQIPVFNYHALTYPGVTCIICLLPSFVIAYDCQRELIQDRVSPERCARSKRSVHRLRELQPHLNSSRIDSREVSINDRNALGRRLRRR